MRHDGPLAKIRVGEDSKRRAALSETPKFAAGRSALAGCSTFS
jgi:hypothetical protein